MSTPEGARKSSEFMAICTCPDFCWTQVGSSRVVLPYMVATDLSASLECSPNVFFADKPAFLYKHSYAPSVSGNELAAPDGGFVSKVKEGVVWGEGHDETVLVNDIPVVRHGDSCWMNHESAG